MLRKLRGLNCNQDGASYPTRLRGARHCLVREVAKRIAIFPCTALVRRHGLCEIWIERRDEKPLRSLDYVYLIAGVEVESVEHRFGKNGRD